MAPEEEVIKVEKPKVRSKKGLFLIIVALALLLFLGVAYFALRTGLLFDFIDGLAGGKADPSVRTEAAHAPEFMYEMPEMLVNLHDETARARFLSVKFYVGYDDAQLEQQLDKRMPEIRDAVLAVLWETSGEDIKTSSGKERLRENILTVIADLLPENKIAGIYFEHVMIQ